MENIMWNPWHGCIKYSEGCKNCYVYLQDSNTWVKIIRNECISNHVSFSFHQTGSVFIQGKNTYYMKPKEERTFAKELNINIFFSK